MSLTPPREYEEEWGGGEEGKEELFRTARSSVVSASVPVEEERAEEQRSFGVSEPEDAAVATREFRRSVIPATPPEDEDCTCGQRSAQMKMKMRVVIIQVRFV